MLSPGLYQLSAHSVQALPAGSAGVAPLSASVHPLYISVH